MKHTYFGILFFVIAAIAPRFAAAQGFGLPPGFDLKTFQKNEEQAMYFLQCDSAWQSVSAFDHLSPSKDVVCYPDKKGWKVVAGTVDSSGFKDANFYIVDKNHSVTAAKKKFDTVMVASMGRALYNASLALNKLNIKAGAWKKFVRINLDQSITVWAFPDMDASGNIWYGPECAWYYSSDGRKLSASKIINKAPVIAGKSGQSLNLSLPTDKMPTIGAIWLAHRYRHDYNEINVTYKTGVSTLRYNTNEKTYAWEHTAN